MPFISFEFVVLLLVCLLLFYVVPFKCRNIILLSGSAVFIGYNHLPFLITAIAISFFTFVWGRFLSVPQSEKKARVLYFSGIASLVLCWLSFRHSEAVIFPLGISFYTFQAISYLTEIYWKEEKQEKNLIDFMVYMLFFMKFLSGPIERSGQLLPQLRQHKAFDYAGVVYGMKLILIGLLKKVVLADHLAPHIDGVFNAVHDSSGIQLLMACLLYPIELYADFSGYTDMAIGGARLFGLNLSPNFNRPFIARTTADFWRRWHISLSFWVRDYLYIPLTAELRHWGRWGIYLSLLVTFVLLGVWHGAGWTFVIYGLVQGIVICYEMRTSVWREKLGRRLGTVLFSSLQIARTYLIFAFSLIFFRLDSVKEAFFFIGHLSFRAQHSWKEMNIGISDHSCIVAGSTLLLILAYEYFNARRDLLLWVSEQPALLRWSIYYVLAFAVFTLGKFGSDNFIYLQF